MVGTETRATKLFRNRTQNDYLGVQNNKLFVNKTPPTTVYLWDRSFFFRVCALGSQDFSAAANSAVFSMSPRKASPHHHP